jgi:opacity protein-like surface antigen
MKKFAMAILGVALCSSAAFATVPSPVFCTVIPADDLGGLFLAPSSPAPAPASINVVTVRNSSNNVIENATVVVTLTAANVVCGSTVLTGTTDAAGQVSLTLGGGGCAHSVPLSGVVKANGITIRAYENVKSPDYDGAAGNLNVELPDLITFAAEFLGAPGTGTCHDYNNDDTTGLPELVLFGPTFTAPNTCAP